MPYLNKLQYHSLLESEKDALDKLCAKYPMPEFVRASTWKICSICNRPYNDHPWIMPFYMLNELCDGTVVKL